jgi:hypothetical protein
MFHISVLSKEYGVTVRWLFLDVRLAHNRRMPNLRKAITYLKAELADLNRAIEVVEIMSVYANRQNGSQAPRKAFEKCGAVQEFRPHPDNNVSLRLQ